MFVSDLMSAPPVTVAPGTSVRAAARLLRERDIAAAPVVDDGGTLVGVVSEIDLLRGALAPDPVAHLLPVTTAGELPPGTVADVMTVDVQVLLPHTDLFDAARLMRSSGIRSLPVVDGGRVVGVVSRSDLLHVLAREDDELAGELRRAIAAELGPHTRVEVEVRAGVVTVDGAGSPAELAAAVLVSRRVPGVGRVQSPAAPGE